MKILIFFVLILLILNEFYSFPASIPVLRYTKKFEGSQTRNFHFYSGDVKELGFNMKDSWICEGAIGFMYPSQVPNSVPLYRYVNGFSHFYTTNKEEGDKAGSQVCTCNYKPRFRCFCRKGEIQYPNGKYKFERIEGYVFSYQIAGSVPVYRKSFTVTKRGFRGIPISVGTDYLYTTDPNESNDYKNEGIAFYVLSLNKIKYDTSDATLWKKFRDHLTVELAKIICGGEINCEKMRNTQFQTISSPMSASWFEKQEDLNDKFCYVSSWKPYFEPKSVSTTGQIDRKYVKFLETIQENQDAKDSITKYQLMINKIGESICFPWEDSNQLKDWVYGSKNSRLESGFDIAHSSSIRNSWSDFGQYSNLGFVGYVKPGVTLNDNFKMSDSEGIVYSYINQIQVLSSSRFDMKFTAEAVKYIEISPSSNWFDKNIIEKYKNQLNTNGFSGSDGKFPLLPIGVFVAIKPKVEMSVSKSVFEEMEKYSNYQTRVIGGVKFNNKNSVSSDKNENFKKIKKEFKSYGNEDFEELDDYLNMVLSDRGGGGDTNVQIKNVVPEFEGEYHITFETNDSKPQIIGIVSKQL